MFPFLTVPSWVVDISNSKPSDVHIKVLSSEFISLTRPLYNHDTFLSSRQILIIWKRCRVFSPVRVNSDVPNTAETDLLFFIPRASSAFLKRQPTKEKLYTCSSLGKHHVYKVRWVQRMHQVWFWLFYRSSSHFECLYKLNLSQSENPKNPLNMFHLEPWNSNIQERENSGCYDCTSCIRQKP